MCVSMTGEGKSESRMWRGQEDTHDMKAEEFCWRDREENGREEDEKMDIQSLYENAAMKTSYAVEKVISMKESTLL